MPNKHRKIEVFSAGCPVCDEAIGKIRDAACPSCDVQVVDMNASEGRKRAKQLGVRSVPAAAVDGKLAGCCTGSGIDLDKLREAGLGNAVV